MFSNAVSHLYLGGMQPPPSLKRELKLESVLDMESLHST